MSKSLTNSLQALINNAAQTLPEKGRLSAIQTKHRWRDDHSSSVILADVSTSMSQYVGSFSKIQILTDALNAVWNQSATVELAAFSSIPLMIASPSALPAPNGSTALHLALDLLIGRQPGKIILISDGEPDSEDAALRSAAKYKGVIDVIYCGSDSNLKAIAFLQKLARNAAGNCVVSPSNQPAKFNLLTPLKKSLLLTSGGAA